MNTAAQRPAGGHANMASDDGGAPGRRVSGEPLPRRASAVAGAAPVSGRREHRRRRVGGVGDRLHPRSAEPARRGRGLRAVQRVAVEPSTDARGGRRSRATPLAHLRAARRGHGRARAAARIQRRGRKPLRDALRAVGRHRSDASDSAAGGCARRHRHAVLHRDRRRAADRRAGAPRPPRAVPGGRNRGPAVSLAALRRGLRARVRGDARGCHLPRALGHRTLPIRRGPATRAGANCPGARAVLARRRGFRRGRPRRSQPAARSPQLRGAPAAEGRRG